MKKIKILFKKIKQANLYWEKGNLDYKGRLQKAMEPIFNELEGLGISRTFSEALFYFGKDFVDSLSEGKWENMSHSEIREMELARKHSALVYRSRPVKGDKVGIEVLLSSKKN